MVSVVVLPIDSSIFPLASSKSVNTFEHPMQTHYAVLSQKTGRSILYVAHIARIYSLIADSNLVHEHIRTTHIPISLQHPIPLGFHMHYIDLVIPE